MTEKKYQRRSDRYLNETEKTENYNKQEKQIKEISNNKKEHPLLHKLLLYLVITFIIFISYSTLIEPKFLNIKEYKIESKNIPSSFHGTKIVHFTDVHYGTTINKKNLEKIINKINEQKPDIIIFTGDLLDYNTEITNAIADELTTSLSNLKCTLYKYAIFGDEDLDNKKYEEIMTNSGFTILDNKSIPLFYKEQTPIILTGYNPIITKPEYNTTQIIEEDTTNYFKIVLTHEPDSIDNFIKYNPNLVLSGHSLGGSINFKFTKPLLLPENSTKYYKDYQKIKNTHFYVSNGLGSSGLNARFLNPPSINLYRLYKTK